MDILYRTKTLQAGEILPEGWIKSQLERDLTEGYIGQFDQVHPTVTHDVFIKKNRRSKLNITFRKEWWSGEHEGYWKDAIIRMAFLTQNKKYMRLADQWISGILKSSEDDGYLGIYKKGDRKGYRFNHDRGNGELWATSRIMMALLAYYEFTNRPEVLDLVKRAAKLVMDHYDEKNYFITRGHGGGISHGIGFFECLEWLFRITDDVIYLDFALKLYNDFNSGNVRDDDLKTSHLLQYERNLKKHGAHIAEGLFVPQFIAAINQRDEYKQAANMVVQKLLYHLTPGGAMRCDEWIKGREGTADERYEYCGIAEMISPLLRMVSFTGRFELADLIETMTFNAGQGARFPVLSALSYFTSDNRRKINHLEMVGREVYDAAHLAAVCCVLNGGRLMPYYTEGMWMKDMKKNAIIALLFGPNQLQTKIVNQNVHINEQTSYPFSDNVKFTIHTDEPVDFSLIIRKPHGCKIAGIDIPEGALIEEKEDFVSIKNDWKGKSEVNVKFDFKVEQVKQPPSKSVEMEGAYLKRGPLVYALPFDYTSKKTKEYQNSGFYRYKLKPVDTDNWNLKKNINDDFDFEGLKNGEQVDFPWDKPLVFLNGPLRDKLGNKKNVKLVPMGNTVFRRVTFSLI